MEENEVNRESIRHDRNTAWKTSREMVTFDAVSVLHRESAKESRLNAYSSSQQQCNHFNAGSKVCLIQHIVSVADGTLEDLPPNRRYCIATLSKSFPEISIFRFKFEMASSSCR